ncbi:MAG TPA: pentapeptide repeat-containing protein [Candidatus Nanoarchaeia archaeon]|nr:pentapeptide repeat-containing protein [Candidatus Nanoarchaeia archaeon]
MKRPISGNVLVGDILAGRRDFQRIQLRGFNFYDSPRLVDLEDYLARQDFEQNPLLFAEAEMEHVYAVGLLLPYSKFQDAKLRNVDFCFADLRYADFWHADLREVDFRSALTEGACFGGTRAYRVVGVEELIKDPPKEEYHFRTEDVEIGSPEYPFVDPKRARAFFS